MLLILANAILLYLVPDPCEKINTPNKQEIWKLDQVWHVSPLNLQKKFYCKEDKLEYFYIKQRDRSSLVAIQKVKITKESSCRNNALFSGKRKLFQGMIQSVKAANNHNPLRSEQTLLSKILSFNESTDHAGTYE
ncbi:MAG TPA: hypothetical protein PLS71_19295, partial [Leptospiraceae bacterium]|nr:hypothetical protein [Leptospiraceae bacterium]